MSLPAESFQQRSICTDLSIEGIRTHVRIQLGIDEKPNQIGTRKGTGLITLTAGQWAVIERILDFAEKMKEINGRVAE